MTFNLIPKSLLMPCFFGKIPFAFNAQSALAEISIGKTELVSINNHGEQAYQITSPSFGVVSDDKRYVAFTSDAFNLISESDLSQYDLYLYNTENHQLKGYTIERNEHNDADYLTVSSPRLSADGRYIALEVNFYNWDKTLLFDDVYILDSQTGVISSINAKGDKNNYAVQTNGKVNNYSYNHSISNDGRVILYYAPNRKLDSFDSTDNGKHSGLFSYDIETGDTSVFSIINQKNEIETGLKSIVFSKNGRYIAFSSDSSDLSTNAVGSVRNVYVFDTVTKSTTLVSAASDGVLDNGKSSSNASAQSPSISADGSIISYLSDAQNLVPDDANSYFDIFIYNQSTNQTIRVPLDKFIEDMGADSYKIPENVQVAEDGRSISFNLTYYVTIAPDQSQHFKKNFTYHIDTNNFAISEPTPLITKQFPRINLSPDGNSLYGAAHSYFIRGFEPRLYSRGSAETIHAISLYNNSISADGRYIVFSSRSKNLVSDEGSEGELGLYIRDTHNQITVRMNLNRYGLKITENNHTSSSPPTITRDGNSIVFCAQEQSSSDIGIYQYNIKTKQVSTIDSNNYNCGISLQISGDGEKIIYKKVVPIYGRSGGFRWDYYYDNLPNNKKLLLNSGQFYRVRHYSLSDNGRFIVFSAQDIRLLEQENYKYQVYRYDMVNNEILRISSHKDGNPITVGDSFYPRVSDNGQYVVYVSKNESGRFDIFLYDTETQLNKRVSQAIDGSDANDSSNTPSLSSDGRFIAYFSEASNLTEEDNNQKGDIFIYDRKIDKTTLVSLGYEEQQGNSHSFIPAISANGNYVTYQSYADNLVADDNNFGLDIFRTELIHGDNK